MGTRIAGTIAIVLATLLCAVWAGYNGIGELTRTQDEIFSARLPAIGSLAAISVAQNGVLAAESGLLNPAITDTKARHNEYVKIQNAWKQIDTAWKAYESSPPLARESGLRHEFGQQLDGFKEQVRRVVDLSTQKDKLVASGVLLNDPKVASLDRQIFEASSKGEAMILPAAATIGKLAAMNYAEAAAIAKIGDAAGSSMSGILLGALLFGAIASILLGLLLLRSVGASVGSLLAETRSLAGSVAAGKLDFRCDPEKVDTEFRAVAHDLNKILDEVSAPIAMIGNRVAMIGKGEPPEEIVSEWRGDFKEIKDNINKCVAGLNGLEECNAVLKRMSVNDNTRTVDGTYSGLFGSMSEGINALRERLLTVTGSFVQLSTGDTSHLSKLETIGRRSQEDVLLPATIKCMRNIRMLVEDVSLLSRAAVEGDLAQRVDAEKHHGGYREIVEGFNQTLDAVVGPLKAAANCVDLIGKGEVPEKITEEYKGDFDKLKNNINNCIDGLGGLVECNAVLTRMAVNDHSRTVHGQYMGLFASVSEATNMVNDRLVALTKWITHLSMGDTSDLAMYEKIGRRCDEDILIPAAIKCMHNIQELIEDMKVLSHAAVDGDLAKRADTEKHHGGYREIAHGVNETLDAVVGPLKVAANYVAQISRGEVPPKITDQYKGDFNEIKNNLNMLIDAMEQITNTAEEIAAGNLTVKVVERSDQDRLMQEMSRMVKGLTEIVTSIQGVATQVATGSKELSSSAEQLSQGATEQSSSVEEISSSMEQMTANIKQNSDNSQQTEKIAVKAAEDGREGGESVSQTVNAMKQIAGKISIIEEIARQTNLLALNAAIEAARAGEHGKGFAVVASEVRKLAERSQEAAGEINELAANSVKVAEKAGSMLARIVPDVRRTSDLVQEINAASNEQSVGAEQINQAIQQLDQVIQHNASAAEQMAAASDELLGQADQLLSTMSFFKTDNTGATAAAATRRGSSSSLKAAKTIDIIEQSPPIKAKSKPSPSGIANGRGVTLDLADKKNGDWEDTHFEQY